MVLRATQALDVLIFFKKKRFCLISSLKFTLSNVTLFLWDNLSGLKKIIFMPDNGAFYINGFKEIKINPIILQSLLMLNHKDFLKVRFQFYDFSDWAFQVARSGLWGFKNFSNLCSF